MSKEEADAVWPVYAAFWKALQDAGINVFYSGYVGDVDGRMMTRRTDGFAHVASLTMPREGAPALISVVRPVGYTGSPDEPARWPGPDEHRVLATELSLIAHEYGHFLLRDERHELVEEERRAWAIGRDALAQRGFIAWPIFDVVKADALSTYERTFGEAKG